MNEFKLIVAGSRDFNDYARASIEIEDLTAVELADVAVSLVSGMARGADRLGVRFAQEHNMKLYEFPADWNTHGKHAGFKRNAEMGKFADGLIVFWDGKSRGTKHMMDYMHSLQKPVWVARYGEPTVLTKPAQHVGWDRKGPGYECSSKGDKRFSAFCAVMPDGRTIEQHYQCDVKGYQPGGCDWRLGKGKPPLDPNKDLWMEYLALWQTWAQHNPELIAELSQIVATRHYNLTDMFANTPVNQARALADILNNL